MSRIASHFSFLKITEEFKTQITKITAREFGTIKTHRKERNRSLRCVLIIYAFYIDLFFQMLKY